MRTQLVAMLLGLAGAVSSAGGATADTCAVRVVFTKAGLVVGVGSGRGILTFRGRSYPFRVSGASFGANIGASTTRFVGRALNVNSPHDIAGTYKAVGMGGALVAGAGGVELVNARGTMLQLRGAKVGLDLSASLANVTIRMD